MSLSELKSPVKRSLVLTNDLDEVKKLPVFVEEVCEAACLDSSATTQINLAVEEAVVNVISYAYPKDTEGIIEIDAFNNDSCISFTIKDNGKPFDPTANPAVDITLSAEERAIGGLGIHLVKEIMDSVDYRRDNDKNILIMMRSLPFILHRETEVFQLDSHSEILLSQFRERRPVFERLGKLAYEHVNTLLQAQNFPVTGVEYRIKAEDSLKGKLELKGRKYKSLEDITDIFGMRIITFFPDDVDKVAVIIKHLFDIDWTMSVDKRKRHQVNSFGYNSLHFICRLPKTIVDDPACPELNEYRFEIQMRTALQHVWSSIEHDLCYKSIGHLPAEYRRQFSRLAGMLELADDEFSRLRIRMTEFRRQIVSLVASGKLEEVPFSLENYRKYLEMHPFEHLNQRIAAVNQAEIYPVSLLPFYPIMENFGFSTLGDVEHFIEENSQAAYQLALSSLAVTDIDIIAENIGIQNLCVSHILRSGGGMPELIAFFDRINGVSENSRLMAETIMKQASTLPYFTSTSDPAN